MGERRALYRVPEGKRLLGKPSHIWEDNNQMDRQEMGCGLMDWNEMAQDSDKWRVLVNEVMNFRGP